MNKKNILGIIIAIIFFCVIVLAIETSISVWQLILGFVIFWPLTLGFTNFRNAFLLLAMTLVLLVAVYLSIKFRLSGIGAGAIVGITIGLLMHFGWIVPHKPFSRTEYINNKINNRSRD